MMTAPWHATVQPVVAEVMAAHDIPGAVIALAQGAGSPEYLVIGADGLGRPLAADTLFPVASISKLAAALAVLRLADAGALAVDGSLDRWIAICPTPRRPGRASGSSTSSPTPAA